jgi:hypothetical protein
MSHGRARNGTVDRPVAAQCSKRPRRRVLAYVGLGLGVVVLALAGLILVFGKAMLNGYGKGRLERAFAAAHPGCLLRIGELDYGIRADRWIARGVTFRATHATFKAARVSLTGVGWGPLWRGTAALADIAKARLEASDLEVGFPQADYGIRCAQLRASAPDSELVAEGAELRPLDGDEAFFAAQPCRMTRFHAVVPECRVLGLAYTELLRGMSYRANSVHFSRPSLDVLVNRDKPLKPFVKSPLMVPEALASIRQPLRVDSLSVTNGRLSYCVRMVAGADPAVLTFGAVSGSVEGIANRGEATAAIHLRAQGDLMDAGTLKVLMAIPITPAELSLQYSGSLSAMDLSRLDAFLDIAEHVRIKSGSAQEAAFEIEVNAGRARGRVRAIYKDLGVAVLDAHTGTETGFDNRVTSFLANVLKVRNANAPDASGAMKEGKVNYTRTAEDGFLEFVWSALWTGVRDVITH